MRRFFYFPQTGGPASSTSNPRIVGFAGTEEIRDDIRPPEPPHEAGFKSTLARVVNDDARRNNLLKDNGGNLIGDVCEGLTAIISINIADEEIFHIGARIYPVVK